MTLSLIKDLTVIHLTPLFIMLYILPHIAVWKLWRLFLHFWQLQFLSSS